MARSIVVEQGGKTSSFGFRKIDRTKLYGQRRRIHLDPAGEPCARASLTDDGALLLRLGMTAQGYFDGDGHWIPYSELQGLGDDGEPLEKVPSTLGESVELEGPVDPQELLDQRNQSVYALDPEDFDDALRESLLAGDVYRLPFNYRAGWMMGHAFLVANPEGDVFALMGSHAPPAWCEPTRLPEVEDDEDDLDDELDFEMF
jgi:hypothetical protein